MRRIYILLALVVLLAAALRFFALGSNPPALDSDEAAWGYNAYSIGTDGRDEFGRFLPHDYLESFGDYKPPVYAYLDVVPVKLFGLNEFATRFPSALFGTLTVFITFFLARRIFSKSKYKDYIGLASAFILATSPWHIMLSRAAFEANVATFFIVCGVWLFLTAMHDKKWYLVLSAVSFVLSVYTFNTARVVSPLLIIAMSIGFYKTLLNYWRVSIVAIIVGIILILPTLKFLLSPQAGLRYQQVNIFSDISLIQTSNQDMQNNNDSFISKLLYNHRLVYADAYLKHYFDNLSPEFLFISGDPNPKFSIQTIGQMYIWDLPFFLIGILFLFRKKEGNYWIVPVWLLLGIVAAATARETPHALRIETSLPTFQIFVAYGLVYSMVFLRDRFSAKAFKTYSAIIAAILFINIVYFVQYYFVVYPIRQSGDWVYGYKQSISYVEHLQKNYDAVYITDKLGTPYIYYLFYTKINPEVYRKTAQISRDQFGFVTVSGFGKYHFASNLQNLPQKPGEKILYIDYYKNVPKNAKVLQQFYFLDNTPILTAYEE